MNENSGRNPMSEPTPPPQPDDILSRPVSGADLGTELKQNRRSVNND